VGLNGVETDPRGNVLGWRRGRSDRALAIAAHLDTAIPIETDVTVKRETGRLAGPGIANRYGGKTPPDAALVQAALRANRSLGFPPQLKIGSTDANVPIDMGIPAVTLSGGGTGGNEHSLKEWWNPAESFKGPQQVVLTILSYDKRSAGGR